MTTNVAERVALAARRLAVNGEEVAPNGNRANGDGVETIATVGMGRRPIPRNLKTLPAIQRACGSFEIFEIGGKIR